MRNDERLRTIYEVMAPYIVRSERNWRDYLAFASRFHKQSFDNILLVYAQDEDVTILATKKQWAGVGRNLISRPKGIAVCVYSNARLTLDYLFDISQTVGREIHPTNWQLSDEMQKALGNGLLSHMGFRHSRSQTSCTPWRVRPSMTTTSIIYRGFGRKQKTICLRKYRLAALKHSISSF